MKNWEVVAEAVVGGGLGMAAGKAVSIPFSSGNSLFDVILDGAVGLAVAYAGTKVGSEELGVAVTSFGLGWTVNAGATALGVQL